jgi:hypothetical protein
MKTITAMLTAGFKWASLVSALAVIPKATANPHTTATCHKPACAPVKTAEFTEPTPKRIIKRVPINSATHLLNIGTSSFVG